MNRLWLIIQREYFSIVGKKSFIVMTILMPFIVVLIGAIPAAIAYFNDSSTVENFAVIDETGKNYAAAIADIDGYHFTSFAGDSAASPREFYDNAAGSISGIIIIPADVLDKEKITIYSENQK